MRRAPIRIRAFLVATVLVLLIVPTLVAGAAWLVEHDRQQTQIQHRLDAATAYLRTHRSELRDPSAVQGFARLVDRLDLLAQVVAITDSPPGKEQVFISPALEKQGTAAQLKARLAGERSPAAATNPVPSWTDDHRVIPIGLQKTPGVLTADLYYRSAPRTRRALVALLSWMIVFLVGLGAAVWLASRWMVAPLSRLSAEVDKVAGGDLAIAVPHSRIGEVANVAQAVEGMTASLGEAAQREAEAAEARRFLVTSVAHDLRTPLFALRGHLQAIRAQIGDVDLHLERAEARADALERLIGNLFAYTRDDYAQPVPHLEVIRLADLVQEAATTHDQTNHQRETHVELDGDENLTVIADRDRLKRVLTNIIDNALRFSPADAPIRVTWARADDSTVELVVQDRGPGIAPELLPHIFEPGIRGASPPGEADTGAGLGLAIAKRLLEHQGATITAYNQDGAAFRLVLRSHTGAESR